MDVWTLSVQPLLFWLALGAGGAVVAWAAGVKRPGLALAAAVPIAVVVVIALTLAQMAVSFPFGWPAFAVGCLTASALARLGRPLVRWLGVANGPGRPRTSMSRSPAAPFASEAARMGGLLLISFLSAAVFLLAAAGWTWETASQTWDAFFDANAVRYAAETGVVAPNRISDFVYPSPIGNFYPSGFHALGALFMKLGGANAVVATNVTAALLAGALWPGVLAVSAYLVFDRRMTPTYVGIVAGWGLVGLPWGPLGWGVLWATALAAMFMPLAIVGFVGGLGWLTGLSRRGGVALFLVSWPLVWMLHPRVGILNGVLVLGLWTWHAAGRVVAAVVVRRSSHLALGWLAAVGLPLLLLSVAVLRVGRNDAQFAMRGWPVEFGVVREVWGYVANGPIDTLPQLLVGGLVLVGGSVCWRRSQLRWLVVLYLGAVLLDIATALLRDVSVFDALARFWYGDRYRTVTLPSFAGVLLVVAAVEVLAPRVRRRLLTAKAWRYAVAVACALVLLNAAPAVISYLRPSYEEAALDAKASVVSPREQVFYDRVASIVPKSDRVLNNARDGSGLLYAYVGRRVVFYLPNHSPATYNGLVLRSGLVTMDHAQACSLFRGDHIRWILNGGTTFTRGIVELAPAPGMEIPSDLWATTLVLSDGDLKLFQVTGCGEIEPDPAVPPERRA